MQTSIFHSLALCSVCHTDSQLLTGKNPPYLHGTTFIGSGKAVTCFAATVLSYQAYIFKCMPHMLVMTDVPNAAAAGCCRWSLLPTNKERRAVFDEFCKDVANQQKLLAAAQAKAAAEGFAALLEEAAELERQLRVSLMAQEEGEEGGAGKGQPQ